MSAAKSLTTVEIEQVLHYISTNANADALMASPKAKRQSKATFDRQKG